ncbi:MAG: type II toxin-antitoxin system VapC family toxin [Phycisphaerales bacterium JB060]
MDTNVVSEPGRRRPDPNVIDWLAAQDGWDAYVSVLTLGEIAQGAARLGSPRGDRYVAWLEDVVIPTYGERVVPVDDRVALAWGRLGGDQAAKGRTIPVIDGLLVATAMVHDLTLVTRNVRDVRGLGVDVIDPGAPRA